VSEQPREAALLVPPPAPAPAEQELSVEEIVDFDPRVAVAEAHAQAVAAEPPAAANLASATCPACGTVGRVDYARRDAVGFCPACDFPLFWSRDRVVFPGSEGPEAAALRRLPGTAGREALASMLCPSCDEPNPATGLICVRCGADLHPVAEPEPVLVFAEPEPEPELPEPERAWWPYILAGSLAIVVLAALLVVLYN
jgi:predicted RNA-binding Zn-ribbon protein involved in translation (DUF1610 family)